KLYLENYKEYISFELSKGLKTLKGEMPSSPTEFVEKFQLKFEASELEKFFSSLIRVLNGISQEIKTNLTEMCEIIKKSEEIQWDEIIKNRKIENFIFLGHKTPSIGQLHCHICSKLYPSE